MVASSSSRPLWKWGEWLVFLSCIYLGLPAILFFGFWLRLPWSIGSLILIGVLFWRLWPQHSIEGTDTSEIPDSADKVSLRVYWWTLAPCLLALPLTGMSTLVAQHTDWHKHTALLQDLVRHSWPVTYEVSSPAGGSFYLLYYQGFYLPIAAVCRLLGEGALPWITLVWAGLGMALVSGWLVYFTRFRAPWIGLLFVVFDGLKLLGRPLGYKLAHMGIFREGTMSSITGEASWWAGKPHFQFPSFFSLLSVVPQHALSGWLGAALLCFVIFHPRARQSSAVLACVFPFCLLWSVFVGFATLLMTGMALFIRGKNKPRPAGSPWQSAGLLGIALCLVGIIGLYYAGRGYSEFSQAFPTFPLIAWANNPAQLSSFLLRVVLWTVLEWALLFWLASRLRPQMNRRELLALGIPFFLLLALPLVHVGAFNDLLTRGIIPAQFFLFLWSANALRNARLDGSPAEKPKPQPQWAKALLIGCFALGPLSNLVVFRKEIRATLLHARQIHDPVSSSAHDSNLLTRWQALNSQPTSGSLQPDFSSTNNPWMWKIYRSQYLGKTDSLWWRFLARRGDTKG